MPAVVSGPGAYSQRSDAQGQPIRNLPDPKYGEATDFRNQQKSAPLAEAPPLPNAPAPSDIARDGPPNAGPTPAPGPAPAPMPGLFDQGDPSIPVTAGAPLGPGPNAVQGGSFAPPPMALSQQIAKYAAAGDDALSWLANHLASMGQ